VSDLAQEGARWAAVRGSQSLTPATATDVQNFVQSRALGMTVTVTTTSVDAAQQCTNTAVDPVALSSGAGICVRVQSNYAAATSLLPFTNLALESTAQMIMAR
jgi:hypothetical protein